MAGVTTVDHHFADTELASLYDRFHPWDAREDFAFYLPMVLAARSVLDVGCGTGMLLSRARDSGHTGRLCGLDPAEGMLAVAGARTDVEWVRGDLGTARWSEEFDLVVMSGHAFQVLLTDDDLRTALATVRAALVPDGRFAFETRNPLARAWERWIPANAAELPTGERMSHQVEPIVEAGLVSFTTTYTGRRWTGARTSHSTLRFLDARSLASFLTEADFTVESRFGDWDRTPLTDESPEIIVVAKRDSMDR
jgi:SAM-dependent methyltransferase